MTDARERERIVLEAQMSDTLRKLSEIIADAEISREAIADALTIALRFTLRQIVRHTPAMLPLILHALQTEYERTRAELIAEVKPVTH